MKNNQEKYFIGAKNKVRREFMTNLLTLDKNALFDEVIRAQLPDTWDGGYSKDQVWMGNKGMELLVDGLKENGFLSNEYDKFPYHI